MPEPSQPMHAPEFPDSLTWVNRPGGVRLADLRGELVVLDFWTLCCVSCTRLFSHLSDLEEAFGDILNVIGVHTPTFPYERDPRAVQATLEQYEVSHPVATDPERQVARAYGIKAWPSLVLLDPESNVAGTLSGDVPRDQLGEALRTLAEQFDLEPTPRSRTAEPPAREKLRFPSAVEVSPGAQRVAVSDTTNHRVQIYTPEGKRHHVIGSGVPGDETGEYDRDLMCRPRGLAFDGPDMLVCDSGNDRVLRVDSTTESVTVEIEPSDTDVAFRSPWDLVVDGERIWVALADSHRILAWNPLEETVDAVLGSGGEGLRDGAHSEACLAQPLGLCQRGDEIFFVDSESCSLRSFHRHQLTVHTFLGEGMHRSGDVDGEAEEAKLQHPHAVCSHGEEVLVADAYNHKVKRFHVEDQEIRTWLGDGTTGDASGDTTQLFEPGGLASGEETIYVADTNNHRVLEVEAETGRSRIFAE